MSPASQSFRFRESRRLLREAPVRLAVSGEDGELVARTRDIATGGMFVSTAETLPVGTAAGFLLELGTESAPDTVEGEAAVVWVRDEPGDADQPAGMGMRFTRLEAPGEERLAMLFSEQPDAVAGADAAAEAAPPAPVEADEAEPVDAAPEEAGVEVDEPVEEEVGEPFEEEVDEPIEEEVDEPVEEETEEPAGEEVAEVAEENVAEAAEEDVAEAAEEDVAKEEPPPAEAAPDGRASEPGDGGGTRAELFGDLAGDDADWMGRETETPSWVWPTVVGVVLVGVLLFFLRGPMMRLVGAGEGGAGEQPAPVAQSFEVPAPVEDAAAEPPRDPAPVPSTPPPTTPRATPPPTTPPPTTPPPTTTPQATPPPTTPPPTTPPLTTPPRATAPPVNATALRTITASARDDRTVVEIVGNAPFERHHVMPLDLPPRLLVRLIGVRSAYDASAVRAPRLRGVRTGVHGQGATRNLHVVLDLAEPDIVATVERRGDRVVVNLSD